MNDHDHDLPEIGPNGDPWPDDPAFEDMLSGLFTDQFMRVLSAAHELNSITGDSGHDYTLQDAIELIFREAALRDIEDDTGIDYTDYYDGDPEWDGLVSEDDDDLT